MAKAYGQHRVLDALSLDIVRGEFLTILGESGSGKTTLLRILAGFEEADSGEVLLEGQSLLALPPSRRPINTVFQNYALFPHLTVFENVAYGLRIRRIARGQIAERVESALRLVRMEQFAKHLPKHVSGGQKQRVSLARALINQPRMILLDEPLSALDANLRAEMQRELKQLQQELGITFVFVTHDQEEAMSISDRIVLLHGGRIEQCGTPREMYLTPRTVYTCTFLGSSNVLRGTVTGSIASCGPFRFGIDRPPGPVTFSLRPERLRLAADADSDQLRFRASVKMLQFQGATVLATLRCEDGTEMTARLPADRAPGQGEMRLFACLPSDFIALEEPAAAREMEGHSL